MVLCLALDEMFISSGRFLAYIEMSVMGMVMEIMMQIFACPKPEFGPSWAIQCPGVSYVVP